jgi:polysaccharide pyruvyl transferase WcaK-like protein
MVETVVARLPETLGNCEFLLLTTYPGDDKKHVRPGMPVQVVGFEPLRVALVEFPIAILAATARLLRLPLGWVRSRACRAMLNSDVVVDVAGISFADGRGVPITVYNSLMTGIPLLLGVPTVKAAQALGSFNTQPNKLLAQIVLPRLSAICARGARTREHLNSLKLSNVTDVADLAFSLEESASLPPLVQAQMPSNGQQFIVVMPSAVVKGLYEATGANYVEAMATLVQAIRATSQLSVVIVPHSYRVGQGEGRMNDGPVCREVTAACADDSQVIGIDADLTAGELRRIVSLSKVLVTSRFHAMISGLATCTPTVVVGWSHKYREVLDDFGLADFGMDSAELSHPQRIVQKVQFALQNCDVISSQIEKALPAVREKSARNFEVIAQVVRQ